MHFKALTAVISIAAISAVIGSVGQAKALSPNTPTNNVSNTVQVASGDTLSGIASIYQTTYMRLFDANPQVQNPNLIYVGETLQIPAPNEQLPNRLMPNQATPADTDNTAPAPSQTPEVTAPVSQTSETPPPTPPQPTPTTTATASDVSSTPGPSVWTQLAQCESSGNWSINTGNGYYGGLQFTLSSWQSVGGSGYPNQASESEQIALGQTLQARQGWGAWPACATKLGLL